MKQIKFFMLEVGLLLIFLCAKCTNSIHGDYRLHISNNSDYNIIPITNPLLVKLGQPYDTYYPDTLLSDKRHFFGIPISKGEKTGLGDIGLPWDSIYKNIMVNDTMSVFIFDAKVLDTYSWEEIRDNYMILKRYDLSLEDLQKLDFTLYYPPTEAMKDIKMYPPYEE